ncbi:MAG: FkbM family methyltransferase [Cyclobacteriaceae bacterium]
MEISFKVKFLNFFRNIFKIPVLERLLVLQTRDKSYNDLICKLVPNAYQYKPGSKRLVERNGIKLNVDISDYIGHYIYFGFEDESFNQLLSLCRQDSVVLDIGTNIGWVALNLAAKASDGKVIGFEPDPFNYSIAINNLRINQRSNLQVFPIGLGSENSKLNLEIRTPSNRGGNRIAPPNSQSASFSEVEIKKLDNFLDDQKIDRVDLIKIDVEGFELKVLKGASEILKKCKPILFIELDDNNLRDQGDSAKELVESLLSMGYQIHNAETKESINDKSLFENCHYDLIATNG